MQLHLAWAPTTPTPLAGPWIFATFDNKTPPAQPAAAVVSTGTYGQLDNVPSPCTSVQMSFLACHSPLVFIPVPQRPRPRSAGNLAPSVSHSPWPPSGPQCRPRRSSAKRAVPYKQHTVHQCATPTPCDELLSSAATPISMVWLNKASWIALLAFVAAELPTWAAAAAKDITQIEHIVLFMQENRAFDHYFGTAAGVRGFGDPNVVISKDTNKPSFYNPVSVATTEKGSPAPPAGVDHLLPWYINHQGGNSNDRWQCSVAGSNGWEQNHAAYDNGNVNKWATKNTPYSLAYYKREDIPLHFAVAEGWTMADNYHESVITSTSPNRISWLAGTMGIDQARNNLGGPAIDNSETPGCETADDGSTYSCYPYKWKTLPEYLEQVGISWQLYQDTDNFDDNPLAWFHQFQQAPNNSALAQKGMAFKGLERFYSDAEQGKLPQVSFIIGPTELSEHPPYGPLDGAWLQKKVVDAVTKGEKYGSTALIISYDETGGWADHVMADLPSISEAPNEWIIDPYNKTLGQQPVGPGFRVPFYVVSPFTRSGGVFSEPAAHESQILFVEQWAKAIGKPFEQESMTAWRRQSLSDLTSMFDFSRSDTSVPELPEVRQATQDRNGQYNGASTCKAKYGGGQPDVPYTQKDDDAWVLEHGFKRVRGIPSEGHFYVFEKANHALAWDAKTGSLSVSNATPDHANATQRFIVHAAGAGPKNDAFHLSPAAQPSQFVAANAKLTTDRAKAAQFVFEDARNGKGYTVSARGAKLPASFNGSGVSIYSVTY